jgi:hypothetical protein
MSAHSLAEAVIAALFALFGGSLLAFLQKVPSKDQLTVSAGVLAVSVGTMVGLYSGLYVNEHELLTPPSARVRATSEGSKAAEVSKYLREDIMSPANAIDQQYRSGQITMNEAYEQLRSIVIKKP